MPLDASIALVTSHNIFGLAASRGTSEALKK